MHTPQPVQAESHAGHIIQLLLEGTRDRVDRGADSVPLGDVAGIYFEMLGKVSGHLGLDEEEFLAELEVAVGSIRSHPEWINAILDGEGLPRSR